MPAALDHKDIGKIPRRISKIKPFISKNNWDGTEFPTGPKDSKNFEQNNKAIAFNILYLSYNTKQVCCAYKSKCDNKRKNQVILLMITDCKHSDSVEKWHYLH